MAGGKGLYLVLAVIIVIAVIAVLWFTLGRSTSSAHAVSSNSSAAASSSPKQQVQGTPKQMLVNELALINTTPSYETAYNLNVPALSSLLSLAGGSGNSTQLLIFKSGTSVKVVFSLGSITVAVYSGGKLGDNASVACTEDGLLPSGSGNGITCTYSNTTGSSLVSAQSANSILKTLNETNVTFIGNKTVIGSPCSEFRITAQASEINSLINQSQQGSSGSIASSLAGNTGAFNGTLVAYACISGQNGLPLSLNLTDEYYDQLLGENRTNMVFSMNATSMGTSVPSSAFEIPVPWVLSTNNSIVNCTQKSVSFSFVSLKNSTNSTVKVSTSSSQYNFTYNAYMYNNQTASVNLGKSLVYGGTYRVNATFARNITLAGGYIIPNICIDGYCSNSDSCYINYP